MSLTPNKGPHLGQRFVVGSVASRDARCWERCKWGAHSASASPKGDEPHKKRARTDGHASTLTWTASVSWGVEYSRAVVPVG